MKRILVVLLVLLASCGQTAAPIDKLGGPIAPQGGDVVSVTATSGGGIVIGGTQAKPTVGLSSVGCSTGNVPVWSGSTWSCGAGGITNSAGNNVIPKSNGTNLVASSATDDGTTFTIPEAALFGAGAAQFSAGTVFTFEGASTTNTTQVAMVESDTGHVGTGGNNEAINLVLRNSTGFAMGVGGTASAENLDVATTCSKTSGTGTLTCTAILSNASGGDNNYDYYSSNGVMSHAGLISAGEYLGTVGDLTHVWQIGGPYQETLVIPASPSLPGGGGEINQTTLTGTGHLTSAGDIFAYVVRGSTTFDTSGGANASGGFFSQVTSSRSAGSNPLTNYAFEANASGGDNNYAFYDAHGDIHMATSTDLATLGVTTTQGFTNASGSADLSASTSINLNENLTASTTGQKIALLGDSTHQPIFSLGVSPVADGTGIQVKNTNSAQSITGYDVGLDTTVQSIERGGLTIYRGAGGGFGGGGTGEGGVWMGYPATGYAPDNLIVFSSGNPLDLSASGNVDVRITTGGVVAIGVSSGTPDTGIARNAAGVLEIDNGTAGTLRDLTLRNLIATGTVTIGGASPITAITLNDEDFGGGADGVITWDGSTTNGCSSLVSSTYTLTRDCFPSSTTVNSGVTIVEAGYGLFVQGSAAGSGTIQNNGGAGTTGGAGGAATGVRWATGGAGSVPGGGATQASNTPNPFIPTVSGASSGCPNGANGSLGAGGGGGSGGASCGAANSGTPGAGSVAMPNANLGPLWKDLLRGHSEINNIQWSVGAGGGAGGNCTGGGTRGGGGGGGGLVVFTARDITGPLVIQALGGAGGAGTGQCGGGGGGSGGFIMAKYSTNPGGATFSVAGGAGAAGFLGSGGTGGSGAKYIVNLSGDGT